MEDLYYRNRRLSNLLFDYYALNCEMEECAYNIVKEIQTSYNNSIDQFYKDIQYSLDHYYIRECLHKYVDDIYKNIDSWDDYYNEMFNPPCDFDENHLETY